MSDITVIMNTYLNDDFTAAATFALRAACPAIPIIYANGHAASKLPRIDNSEVITMHEESAEVLRNTAALTVKTKFMLIMDNDVKVLSADALLLLTEAIESHICAVQSGAYGVKVVDWQRRIAYVGTDFTGHMDLDASPCYFSMYLTEAYNAVGGMPLNDWFYPTFKAPPERKGTSGDLAITSRFKMRGWRCVSPSARVPVIHWGKAIKHQGRSLPAEDQWYSTNTHIRCSPLNDWLTMEQTRK